MDKGTARSALSCRYSCGILVVAAGNLRRRHYAHQVVGRSTTVPPAEAVPRNVSESPPEPHGHDHYGPARVLG